ncbi:MULTISPECIES: hypothetical protein [Microbulbifer]|uniref:hypothetical protein n=1 Tax=Microbulbifer TaxID=48073 RepID=UPI001E4C457A|nr:MULTISPECIES: hypothetical protein [Microbulbifer]UHQ55079.1 hypothetical protein LVE68_16450 [Microbulbifer sp. YPW16]
MRLFQQSLIAATALFIAGSAFADCDKPQLPEIPDGSTASQESMLQGQKAVKQYLQEGDAYLKCLEQENKAALATAKESGVEPDSEAARQLQAESEARVQEHNATVDAMHNVGNQFNQAVKSFKAANQ